MKEHSPSEFWEYQGGQAKSLLFGLLSQSSLSIASQPVKSIRAVASIPPAVAIVVGEDQHKVKQTREVVLWLNYTLLWSRPKTWSS